MTKNNGDKKQFETLCRERSLIAREVTKQITGHKTYPPETYTDHDLNHCKQLKIRYAFVKKQLETIFAHG